MELLKSLNEVKDQIPENYSCVNRSASVVRFNIDAAGASDDEFYSATDVLTQGGSNGVEEALEEVNWKNIDWDDKKYIEKFSD